MAPNVGVESPYESKVVRRGALRSKIVARLSGLTPAQLRYWHETKLIRAAATPGAKGVPRLYTWAEYMRLRAAKKLLDEGLSTRRVRRAIRLMDSEVPHWYLLPVEGFSREALLDVRDLSSRIAFPSRQLALPIMNTLERLVSEGPLGELNRYSAYVDMNPTVVSGNPVIRGTRLEPQFILALVERGVALTQIKESYRLSSDTLAGALEFVRAAA